MQDDSNHKLDASVRFVCSRVLLRRIREAAREVKRRTVSEFIRSEMEKALDERDRMRRVPGD